MKLISENEFQFYSNEKITIQRGHDIITKEPCLYVVCEHVLLNDFEGKTQSFITTDKVIINGITFTA